MCVAINFINNFGSHFKLYSSLKHEGYLVTGSSFKLKLIIDRHELHSHVIFYAVDPTGEGKILLNGVERISEPVISGCPEFVDVLVTSERGQRFECLTNISELVICDSKLTHCATLTPVVWSIRFLCKESEIKVEKLYEIHFGIKVDNEALRNFSWVTNSKYRE